MITGKFSDRAKMHDELGLPAVDYLFSLMGYQWFQSGIEREKEQFIEAMKSRNDPLALKYRFCPDRLYTSDAGIIACEVKCDFSQHENFSIEFDSYLQATKWCDSGYTYTYAFIDMVRIFDFWQCNVKLCDAINIPAPTVFFVPMRLDYKSFVDRIEIEFPGATIQTREHRTGSGTPYILMAKNSEFLVSPTSYFYDNK